MSSKQSMVYVITLGRSHILPCLMLLRALRAVTHERIVVIGNLEPDSPIIRVIRRYEIEYIDENEIQIHDRVPRVTWQKKYREWGWYKQQFIRLCLDRYLKEDFFILLDSEVFPFANWDEARFFNASGQPRLLSWVPAQRKSDWDYMMYKGSAYLLQDIPGCEDVLDYADSDGYRRHITGVFIWSRENLGRLWGLMEEHRGLEHLKELLEEKELSFSEMELYGLAARSGLFDDVVRTDIHDGLLGWYDAHGGKEFDAFKGDAMWSMCQHYGDYPDSIRYWAYMVSIAQHLGRELPRQLEYWLLEDEPLLVRDYSYAEGIDYFRKYEFQLDFTDNKRFRTSQTALKLLSALNSQETVIAEIGALSDASQGGMHSTYKLAEYLSRFGGMLHSIDENVNHIEFSKLASYQYNQFVRFHPMSPATFFSNFSGTIDMLYVSSFERTSEMEVQSSYLAEAIPNLAEHSLVLIDNGELNSKNMRQFLEENGFQLMLEDHQRLYVR